MLLTVGYVHCILASAIQIPSSILPPIKLSSYLDFIQPAKYERRFATGSR